MASHLHHGKVARIEGYWPPILRQGYAESSMSPHSSLNAYAYDAMYRSRNELYLLLR